MYNDKNINIDNKLLIDENLKNLIYYNTLDRSL